MEYRELFVTGGVGALLLACVFAYRALDKSEPSSAAWHNIRTQNRPVRDAGFAPDAKTEAAESAPQAIAQSQRHHLEGRDPDGFHRQRPQRSHGGDRR